jgi:hypothetical protein
MIAMVVDDVIVARSGMPPNAQVPVQVWKLVAVTDTVNGQSLGRSDFHQNACRQVGGQRIFAQMYSSERK